MKINFLAIILPISLFSTQQPEFKENVKETTVISLSLNNEWTKENYDKINKWIKENLPVGKEKNIKSLSKLFKWLKAEFPNHEDYNEILFMVWATFRSNDKIKTEQDETDKISNKIEKITGSKFKVIEDNNKILHIYDLHYPEMNSGFKDSI